MRAFQLSFDSLIHFYKALEYSACKTELVKFAQFFGRNRGLFDLYKAFLSRSARKVYLTKQLPNQEEWKRLNAYRGGKSKPFLGSANQREMMNQMLSDIDITKDGDMMIYHFDRSEINGELIPSSVLVLNQDIVIDYWDEAQRPYFAYFFAFMYGKTPHPEDFLDYHLTETFRHDIKRYNAFLMTINYGSEQASEGYVHLLKGWIKERMDSMQWKTLPSPTPYSFESLMGIIASQERYEYLINVLASKRFLNAHGAFVYAKRDKRAVAVALLETLISRQFTKGGIEWTNDAKVTFLQKAWGLNVSPTSSHLRSLLPEYRKRFSFLAMAKQVDPGNSS